MGGGRPQLFERLKAGLEESIAHCKSETALRATTLTLPSAPPNYDAIRIRELRSQRGLSQTHFARLLNVSLKTLQSWEQGVRTPGASAARLLQVVEDPRLLSAFQTPPPD